MAPEERRALRILADAVQHGITIPVLMMVHGFPADLLAGLMLDGLATKSPEPASADSRTIEATILRITDAGREVLRMPPPGHAEAQIRKCQQVIARFSEIAETRRRILTKSDLKP
jgi:hypothetical protein